ncbi:hypothetical protein MNBD_DELTA02-435 [hydrothermal vent metagenome]|uniref:HTH cro/C1-type domain-containing protein n=1 Tax=hydrothermal vent metagenome TaxID=652676 RepID=A0A3B0V2B1_9ZZZZ
MQVNYADIIERMKESGKLKNDSAVARVLGVTPQALSNYKKRGRMPTNLIIRFASIYAISVDWLLTGKGGMHGSTADGSRFAMAGEDSASYLNQAENELEAALGGNPLGPDEIIYIGKLLKVLRSNNESTVTALKCSVDAFLKSVEPVDIAGGCSSSATNV